jgi:hypothetical protein
MAYHPVSSGDQYANSQPYQCKLHSDNQQTINDVYSNIPQHQAAMQVHMIAGQPIPSSHPFLSARRNGIIFSIVALSIFVAITLIIIFVVARHP